jgi:hypothetical protein
MMGGGGGGADENANARQLVRTVGALATLDAARNRDLTPEQRQKVSALAKSLQGEATLTEEQCEAKINEIEGLLTAEQKEFVDQAATFGRGGGGRGGGGGAPGGGGYPGGGGGGAPGGGAGGGGGMGGGGGQTDWTKPFAGGRAKDRLDGLLESLGK